jgi:hypothetical protein
MLIQRYHRSFLKFFMFFGLPYSTTMATTANNKNYHFLEKIFGYENRKNDVLFFPNSTKSLTNGIVYYFGGDIQVCFYWSFVNRKDKICFISLGFTRTNECIERKSSISTLEFSFHW